MFIEEKKKDFPVIYLRFFNGELLYIGESQSYLSNRHCREDNSIGDYDKIKILKATEHTRRRRYWEAVLIKNLKPKFQNPLKYASFVLKENGEEVVVDKVRKKPFNVFDKKTKFTDEEIINNLNKLWKIKLLECLDIRKKLEAFEKTKENDKHKTA